MVLFIYFFKQSLCSDFTVLLLDWKIKSGYKFYKMFITIYLIKITLFYVFISCRFKLNVLVLYKNMFHLRTTIFLYNLLFYRFYLIDVILNFLF